MAEAELITLVELHPVEEQSDEDDDVRQRAEGRACMRLRPDFDEVQPTGAPPLASC